jgi:putative transposase
VQQNYLLDPIYYKVKKIRVSRPDSEALKRFDAVERFEKALAKGLNSKDASKVVGVPRSTLYRWQKKKTVKLDSLISKSRRPNNFRKPKSLGHVAIRIQELRQNFPRWGKKKITILLKREGINISESAVGRVISGLLKRGVIASAKLFRHKGVIKAKPKRPYAVRLKRGQRLFATAPGEAIQIDHMSVPIQSGCVLKHFNAVCTVSRWNTAEVYSQASAKTASIFIDKLISQSPFPIQKIQVDGGSEFMAEFEQACQKNNIELAVLAPKSPKLNGNVERINGTWRTDFYELYDLPTQLSELRPLLQDYMDTYNWDRPHEALDLQTPQEFLESLGYKFRVSQSHML